MPRFSGIPVEEPKAREQTTARAPRFKGIPLEEPDVTPVEPARVSKVDLAPAPTRPSGGLDLEGVFMDIERRATDPRHEVEATKAAIGRLKKGLSLPPTVAEQQGLDVPRNTGAAIEPMRDPSGLIMTMPPDDMVRRDLETGGLYERMPGIKLRMPEGMGEKPSGGLVAAARSGGAAIRAEQDLVTQIEKGGFDSKEELQRKIDAAAADRTRSRGLLKKSDGVYGVAQEAVASGAGMVDSMLQTGAGNFIPGVGRAAQFDYWRRQFIGQELIDNFHSDDPSRPAKHNLQEMTPEQVRDALSKIEQEALLYAGVEFIGGGMVGKMPWGQTLTRRLIDKIPKKLKNKYAQFFTQYLGDVAQEAMVEESLQQTSSDRVENAMRRIENENLPEGEKQELMSWMEMAGNALESGVSAVPSMALLGLGMAGGSAAKNYAVEAIDRRAAREETRQRASTELQRIGADEATLKRVAKAGTQEEIVKATEDYLTDRFAKEGMPKGMDRAYAEAYLRDDRERMALLLEQRAKSMTRKRDVVMARLDRERGASMIAEIEADLEADRQRFGGLVVETPEQRAARAQARRGPGSPEDVAEYERRKADEAEPATPRDVALYTKTASKRGLEMPAEPARARPKQTLKSLSALDPESLGIKQAEKTDVGTPRGLDLQALEESTSGGGPAGSAGEGDASRATLSEPDGPSPDTNQPGPVDRAAEETERPTPEQAKAGEYKKGKAVLHGLSIAVETPAGTSRRPEWPPLKDHYGEIARSEGKDGDPVDVFVRPGYQPAESDKVYVVDQIDPATGKLDEHKAVLGYDSPAAAKAAYLRNYAPDWKGFGGIKEMPMEAFRAWVKSDEPRKQKKVTGTNPEPAAQATGVKPPPQAPPNATPGSGPVAEPSKATVEKSDKPPELMTPEERGVNLDPKKAGGVSKWEHRMTEIDPALKARKPVSAAAVDAYGMTLPDGYVKEGDRYTFKEKPAESTRSADAAGAPKADQLASMSEAEFSSIFDEAAREVNAEQPRKVDTIRVNVRKKRERKSAPKATPSDERASVKTLKEVLDNVAANGVKGAEEAMTGLYKLFGGAGRVNMGLTFDEKQYQAAKPHFQAAYKAAVESGKSLKEFVVLLIRELGSSVKPYLERFRKDLQSEQVKRETEDAGENRETANRERNEPDGGLGDGGTPPPDAASQGLRDSGAEPVRDVAGRAERAGGDAGLDGGERPGTARRGAERERGDGVERPDAGGAEDAGGMPAADRRERESRRPDPVADVAAPRKRAELRPEERNFRITSTEQIAPRGDKAKLNANIEAIRLLKRLESENDRLATPEEKAVLARYVGWGGFKEAFNDTRRDDYSWERNHGKTNATLHELLTDEEFAAAALSADNAHYTSPVIIDAMWKAARRMGFRGGRVVEPGAGVGHFFGLMPEDFAAASSLVGVELDSLTGRILRKLYPEADIRIEGFEKAKLPNNSVDLFIGNVPFHEVGPGDPNYPKLNLHNYFFARAFDKVRPGGLVIFVTSNSTLDNNVTQRKYLSTRADLVAAIRLPNDAFMENAKTEVTTDILIFRKQDGTPFDGESWANSAEVNGVRVNEYWSRHPDNALGRHTSEGTMYRGNSYALVSKRGQDTTALLTAAVERLPEGIMGYRAYDQEGASDVREKAGLAGAGAKESQYQVKDGAVWQAIDGELVKPDWMSPDWMKNEKPERRAAIAAAWIPVRDAMTNLLRLETKSGSTDAEVEAARKLLNKAYDAYHAKFGSINNDIALRRKARFLEDDPEYFLVTTLEVPREIIGKGEKRETVWVKAPIFRERINKPVQEPERVESIVDAVNTSLNFRGRIDVPYVAKLLNAQQEDVERQLLETDRVFRDPRSGLLEAREKYLSGNVRLKLREAQAAAEAGPEYQRNIDALKSVQPDAVAFPSIKLDAGAPWVPSSVYSAFLTQIAGTPVRVQWSEAARAFSISYDDTRTPALTTTYASNVIDGTEAIQHAINGTEPTIYKIDPNDRRKRVYDAEGTASAKGVVARIRKEFMDWTRTTDAQVDHAGEQLPVQMAIEESYNDRFNGFVPPNYTGEYYQTIPGLSDYVTLFPHRVAAVARMVMEGGGMLAHGVGSGKTITQVILAMELRRLGFVKKPLFVVHNATLSQFARDVMRAYPSARILVATEKSYEKKNRKRFFGQMATGDWDGIIMSQSQFNLLESDPKATESYFLDKIGELESALALAKEDGDQSTQRMINRSIRGLQAMLDRVTERMKTRQDDSIYFEHTGVDALLIDEAHRYKNVPVITRSRRIKGIPSTISQQAINLEVKVDYIHNRTGGKNIFLATGTPIVNTMAEAYVMLRLSAPKVLEERGIRSFDEFKNTFGQVVEQVEFTWGGTWKMVERFAKFVNVPELITMIRSGFDVRMGNKELGLDVPDMAGGHAQMRVIDQTESVSQIMTWIQAIAKEYEGLTGQDRKLYTWVPIMTMQMGVAAAVDPRLVNPNLPDDPDSKVNTVVNEVVRMYRETKDRQGTQLILLDRFAPMNIGKLQSFLPMDSTAATQRARRSGDQVDVQAILDDMEREAEAAKKSNEDDAEREEKAQDKAESDSYNAEGLNLYRDMRQKLIAAGIPEREIAIIHEHDKQKQRESLSAKFNRGEIRVLMGSTAKLGVGMNLQERLYALHEVDPPRDMTPAMREQRIGRIIRQGNNHSKKVWDTPVHVIEYGTKGTMDTSIYQIMERKQTGITQALMGRSTAREMEDPADEVLMDMRTMIASLADDPRVMRKAELEKLVRDLEVQWDSFVSDQHTRRRRMVEVQRQRTRLRDSEIPSLEDTAVRIAAQIDGKSWNARIGNRELKERKEVVSAISDMIADAEDRARADARFRKNTGRGRSEDMTLNGFNLAIDALLLDPLQPDRMDVQYTLTDPRNRQVIRTTTITSADGVLMSVGRAARDWPSVVEDAKKRLARTDGEERALKDALERKFDGEAELAALRAEYDALRKQLLGRPDEPASAAESESGGETAPTVRMSGSRRNSGARQRLDELIEQADSLAGQVAETPVESALEELRRSGKADIADQVLRAATDHVERHRPHMAAFQSSLQRIADGTGSVVRGGRDLKRVARVADKSLDYGAETNKSVEDYKNNVAFVMDVLRATLVVGDVNDLMAVVEAVEAEFGALVRKKDRWANPTDDGYSDILLNVTIAPGVFAEVQVNTQDMIDAKHVGHKLYARARLMDEDSAEYARLEQAMRDLYEAARSATMEASTSASNSSREMFDASRRYSGSRTGPALPPKYDRALRSGVSANGASSLSKNRVPAGNLRSEPFIDAPPTSNGRLTPSIVDGKQKTLSVGDVQTAVGEALAGIKLPNLRIVKRQDDLPDDILARASRMDFEVYGVYSSDGNIYLVAENLEDADHARETLLHEAVVHYGLPRLLGERFNSFLDDVEATYRDDPRMQEIREEYDLRTFRLSDRREAAEEFLAQIAERRIEEPSLWQRAVALIRDLLRKIGFVRQVSENDIQVMLARSVDNLRAEAVGEESRGTVAAFSGARNNDDITLEHDRKYLAAVERGDMETAQRMVDEAAQIAGYNLGPVYHGTESEPFTVFKKDPENPLERYYFSDEYTASGYKPKNGGALIKAYLKMKNPKTIDWDGASFHRDEGSLDAFIAIEEAKEQGHDGLIFENFNDTADEKDRYLATVHIVFRPNQIKSAEAVTYDASGNPIPLGKRFRAGSPDIRFSGRRRKAARAATVRAGPAPSAEVAELVEEMRRAGELLQRAAGIEGGLVRREERERADKRVARVRQNNRERVREAKKKGREDYRKKLDRYREKVTTVDEKPRLQVPDKVGPLSPDVYDQAHERMKAFKPKGFERFKEAAGLKSDRTGLFGKAFGIVSERLRSMAPELLRHFRRMQFDIAESSLKSTRAVAPFLRKWRKLSPQDRDALALALSNGDQFTITKQVQKNGLADEYAAARTALDEVYERARAVGFDVGYREHYWPRVIKQGKDGEFLDYLMKSPSWSLIEEALLEEMQRRGGRALTQDEKIALINGWLRGRALNTIDVTETPNMKQRLLETLDPEAFTFYEDIDVAVTRYIEGANRAIAWREFFGYANPEVAKLRAEGSRLRTQIVQLQNERRELERESGYDAGREAQYEERIKGFSDKLVIVDNELALRIPVGMTADVSELDQSIGALLDDLRKNGTTLTHNQEQDLKEIIQSLYGEQGPGAFWSGYRNVEYLSTMGSISSAMTQIMDLGMSFYNSGAWHSVPALGRALARKSPITKEMIGIDDIAHEFKDKGFLAAAVRNTFKITLLDYMDRVGKETLINAEVGRMRSLAKAAQAGDQKAAEKLRRALEPVLGPAVEATINDLADGNVTDAVRYFAFNELSDFQPTSLLEHPEGYMRGGNWRTLYMLKSYTLRQIGVYRREIIEEFRKGNRLDALRNMIRLGLWLALFGAASDLIKDFFFNREVRVKDLIEDNLWKLTGLSKWQIYQVKDAENLGVAAWKLFGPPSSIADSILLDLSRPDSRGSRLPGRIPVIGKLFESHLGRMAKNPRAARNLNLEGEELVAEASRFFAVGNGDVRPRKGMEEPAAKILERWRETTGRGRYDLAEAIRRQRARED